MVNILDILEVAKTISNLYGKESLVGQLAEHIIKPVIFKNRLNYAVECKDDPIITFNSLESCILEHEASVIHYIDSIPARNSGG